MNINALNKYVKKTIEKIEKGEYQDVQDWMESLTKYRMESLIAGVDADVKDAKEAIVILADRFARRETGMFGFRDEEMLANAKHLHEALALFANVRLGRLRQEGRFKITDNTTVRLVPTKEGLKMANDMMGQVAENQKAKNQESKDDSQPSV